MQGRPLYNPGTRASPPLISALCAQTAPSGSLEQAPVLRPQGINGVTRTVPLLTLQDKGCTTRTALVMWNLADSPGWSCTVH